ncbi:MAG: DUF2157 domain-containing protein [Nitrospinota bacterium]|nr:DUF2157 domain-containing protein [Nitrospinota bacterium]
MDPSVSQEDRRWLARQIAEWEKSPAVTADQLAELKARFGPQRPLTESPTNRIMNILSIMGALLVGAGVILFIASNWKAIPVYLQLGVVFGVIIGVNHAGFRLRFSGGPYARVGAGLLLLGSALFGAGIWLVAQIYNITTMTNTGVLVWALGTLPAGVILGLESITVFSNALLLTWALMTTFNFGLPRHEYLLITLFIYFPAIYWHKSPKSLFLALIGLAVWLGASLAETDSDGPLFFLLYVSFGALIYLAGLFHLYWREGNVFSFSYRFAGILCLWMATFALGFKDMSVDLMSFSHMQLVPAFYWRYFIALLSGAMALAFMTNHRASKAGVNTTTLERAELMAPGILVLAPFMALANPGFVLNAVIFNTLALALAVGAVFIGSMRRENSFVNLGFLMFALLFVTRYFEWMYEYFSKSLFFIVSGVTLLLLAAYLERTRRKIIESMREGHEQKL